jgi:hypothetical protein
VSIVPNTTTLSDQEVVDIAQCPGCLQPKGVWCVYMPTAYPSAMNADKVGQPTRRAHNVRRARAYAAFERKQREQTRVRLAAARWIDPHYRVAAEIRQAELRWERAQQLELRAWLTAYGYILTQASS